ncbi:protein of unknown function [Salegentibacter echinorum]|uniref:DUF4294 domain-containing protein n=1 Tax=Salegentibacter echinorum TaxID=1073325 RepID=A0A1M5J6I9_SALEC|nr:DUF4294 domain-containing protein [Salegentibacter echinorum]SHG36194.1 protein of unknown function [Salegentibacter echinorum]
MPRILFVILFFAFSTLFAQDSLQVQDTLQKKYMIIAGDTVPRESIDLKEVVILKKLRFNSLAERRRYLILRRKTRKVYPYAKLASERLVELNSRLEAIESKSKRRSYTRIVQKYIEDEFSAELKKLTHTEGQILVKLVHRQTGTTTFNLIKNLKSGWRAFWYNTTASLFEISLKEEYDPKNNHEDFLIEDILQRSFMNNLLEPQATALDFEYVELTDKWSETRSSVN